MNGFFVKVNEKEQTQVSAGELRDLVSQGNGYQDVLVWDTVLEDWISPRRLTEIKPAPGSTKVAPQKCPTILALAGGKGGVGKSVMSTSIGVGLASLGKEVILVDGDLAGPDLHTCMGILDPKVTFFDFYTLAKDSLSEIVLETPVPNLGLISGACGTLGVANPKYHQKQRLIREIKKLSADYVVLDLGAGASYNVIDFFLQADEPVIVATPEPTSIHEAFGFLKICLMRALSRRLDKHPKALGLITRDEVHRPGKTETTIPDLLEELLTTNSPAFEIAQDLIDSFQPKLILNMVKARSDVDEAIALQTAAQNLLSINVAYTGSVSFDSKVSESVRRRKPFLLHAPKCRASQDLSTLILSNLLGKKNFKEVVAKRAWRRQLKVTSVEFSNSNSTEIV